MQSNRMSRVRNAPWLAAAALLTACVGTDLAVPASHPGSPTARAGALPPTSGLHAGSAATAQPVPSAAAAHDGHAGHEHSAAPAAAEPQAGAPPSDAQAATYTCPMHPEIVRKEPGGCPICGMKLVPKKEKK